METVPSDVLRLVYKDFLRLRSDAIQMGFETAFRNIIECMVDGIAPQKQYDIFENVKHTIRIIHFVNGIETKISDPEYITNYTKCVFFVGETRYVIRLEALRCNRKLIGHGKPDVLYSCEVYTSHSNGDRYIDIIRDVVTDTIPVSHSTVGVCWSGQSAQYPWF